MRLEHPDYIKHVTEEFKRKRLDNSLSPALALSTPASIKRECIHVCEERYDKKDEIILRAFFGPGQPGKKYVHIIERFDTSKFKPLDNYLKGLTESTDDKNINLLAWLIDFRPRPYAFGIDADIPLTLDKPPIASNEANEVGGRGFGPKRDEVDTKKVNENPGIDAPVQNPETPNIPPQKLITDDRKKKTRTMIIVAFALAVGFFGVSYFLWRWQGSRQNSLENANGGCMYWADSCYEEMPCNEERAGLLKLPLDLEKMKNFRRIMRVDTITEKSIGNIYYIKNKGAIEYYTAGGNHPVEVTRSLHKLSAYMFEHYFKKN
jgi:hypothetical protein